MLRQLFFGAAVCVAGVAMASDTDDVQAASKKLADTGNYTWKTTSESTNGGPGGGFGGGPQEGKTEKDGFTQWTMHSGDREIQVVKKGEKGAVKTEDAWQTLAELEGDGQGFGRILGPMLKALKTPAATVDEIASKLKEVKKDGEYYTAEVSGDDAKTMMMNNMGGRGRRGGDQGGQGPQIANAKIAMKIWLTDGMISKYTLHATGTISFNGNDIDIDRTTSTEFSAVGSTKVDVPDEVKKKLE